MKQTQNETLGFKLALDVPETPEEFDRLAGKQGACVEEANSNVIYRGWNAEFRRKLVERLEKDHPDVKRAVVGQGPKRKDGTVPDILESEKKYLNRLLASGVTRDQLQPIAVEIASGIKFDPSAAERSTKVGKEYLELADGVIARGKDATEAAVEKLKSLNPTFGDVERYEEDDEEIPSGSEVGSVTRESLGALIKANTMRKAAEDLA